MLMIFIYILSLFSIEKELSSEIQMKLEEEFNQYVKIEFEIVRAPQNYKSIQLLDDRNINIIGDIAYIPVEVVDNRSIEKQTFISVKFMLFKNVFISKNDLEKKKIIDVGNLELVLKDVSSVKGKLIESIEEISGTRAKRYVRKGEVLTFEMIEPTPVIFPGDKIIASTVVGNVIVTTEAFSRQEGKKGDVIKIRTKDNKQYKAEVLDDSRVLIIE